MRHPHSASPRQLAVPGIGFPQFIFMDPEPVELTEFRDRSDERLSGAATSFEPQARRG
jgi:hypothetical protein